MTVIVYRDGMIAADQGRFEGSTKVGTGTKIVARKDGALCGTAGNAMIGTGFKRWFLDGGGVDRPYMGDATENIGALIVQADGRVEHHDRNGWYEIDEEFVAIGCGNVFALGALEMGADARRAVEVAMKFEGYTAGGIDVLFWGQEDGVMLFPGAEAGQEFVVPAGYNGHEI